jgi:hypothetical protein
MKLALNTILVDIDDKPILEAPGKELTVRKVLVQALANAADGDGKTKFDKYELAVRVKNADAENAEFSAEDVVSIKESVGKGYTALVVGQVFKLLGA